MQPHSGGLSAAVAVHGYRIHRAALRPRWRSSWRNLNGQAVSENQASQLTGCAASGGVRDDSQLSAAVDSSLTAHESCSAMESDS